MKPKYQPCSGNAPGPFYVLAGGCISCFFPCDDPLRWERAALMDVQGGLGDRDHCRFHRQPETDTEVEVAIREVRQCRIHSIRYAGDDKTILDRIDRPNSCDMIQ